MGNSVSLPIIGEYIQCFCPVNLFVMVLALICEKCRKWKDQYNLRNRAGSKEDQKEY